MIRNLHYARGVENLDQSPNPIHLTSDMEEAIDGLAGLEGVELSTRTAFSDLTTLRLGGVPRAVVRCSTTDAVVDVVRTLDDANVPLLIVGGGSNLVVADELEPLVAVVIEADNVTMSTRGHGLESVSAIVEAEAGAVWDEVVEMSVDAGFGGLECLSGIPGSAGATPVQNVGAYGAEVSQVLDAVQLYDRATGSVEWVEPESLDLSYRYSNLKFTARAVVLAVRFELSVDGMSAPLRYGELARRLGVDEAEAAAGEIRRPAELVREKVLELRRGKGMVLEYADRDTWSAGSFFTNPIIPENSVETVRAKVAALRGTDEAANMPAFPAGPGHEGAVKLSAAWLIERAGFPKGYPGDGAPARLSTKHTLALTNRGMSGDGTPTTAADLVALARDVRAGVEKAFGVTLVPEPVWVGVSID
ncbi:FAD binding domain protein [Corynebacterium sp. ATCC 6931]|nr:FAD binding domain protein [Corynebacterium sp. ATCC 6931]KAA9289401.1 UDP-N-acetylmuramate dehydrogenase [Corynebacterium amycolatum]MBC6726150.1 UDP-N-acetylenolpyruvoylglucosamine reductase [Corynebacterium amycolatum]MBC6758857.1 UDP-N-acetylenolpyruvoylglucosamine reductase [Corynebacterium sp. LK24]